MANAADSAMHKQVNVLPLQGAQEGLLHCCVPPCSEKLLRLEMTDRIIDRLIGAEFWAELSQEAYRKVAAPTQDLMRTRVACMTRSTVRSTGSQSWMHRIQERGKCNKR